MILSWITLCAAVVTVVVGVSSDNTLTFKDEFEVPRNDKSVRDSIKQMFPIESALCLVLLSYRKGQVLPSFGLPVYIKTREEITESFCSDPEWIADGYIFLTDSLQGLEEMVDRPVSCVMRKSLHLRSKNFLLVHAVQSAEYLNESVYVSFLRFLWQRFGLVFASILPLQQSGDCFRSEYIFAYNPFFNWDKSKSGLLLKYNVSEDFVRHLNKRLDNLHGYRIQALHKGPMIENEKFNDSHSKAYGLKYILEDYYNLKMSTVIPAVGKDYSKTVDESILKGSVDFIVRIAGIIGPMPYGYQVLGVHEFRKLIIAVEKPEPMESWQIFLYSFRLQVYLGLGLVVTMSGVLLAFSAKVLNSNAQKPGPDWFSCFVIMLKATMSASVNRLPRAKSHRVLIASNLVFGLVLVTAYFAKTFALLKNRPMFIEIRTLEDLKASGRRILVPNKSFLKVFDNYKNTALQVLMDKVFIDESLTHLGQVPQKFYDLLDGEHAFVCEDSWLLTMADSQKHRAVTERIHVIEDWSRTLPAAHVLPTNVIFYEKFNSVKLRVLEYGLFSIYEAYDKIDVSIHVDDEDKLPSLTGALPFTYSDLKISFFIIYLGLSVSLVCFVAEVIIVKYYGAE